MSDTAPEPKFVIRGEPNPLNVITISAEGELHVRGELVHPDVYALLAKLVRLIAAFPEARTTGRDLDPKAVNEALDALLASSDKVRSDLAKVRAQLVLAEAALEAADELACAVHEDGGHDSCCAHYFNARAAHQRAP